MDIMYNQLWSWGLAAIGLLGIYLAGRKNSIGWLVGVFAQFLWISYAIVTKQWGFIFTAIAYATIYTKNWISWRKESTTEDEVNVNAS